MKIFGIKTRQTLLCRVFWYGLSLWVMVFRSPKHQQQWNTKDNNHRPKVEAVFCSRKVTRHQQLFSMKRPREREREARQLSRSLPWVDGVVQQFATKEITFDDLERPRGKKGKTHTCVSQSQTSTLWRNFTELSGELASFSVGWRFSAHWTVRNSEIRKMLSLANARLKGWK